jgi:hypothetical protein
MNPKFKIVMYLVVLVAVCAALVPAKNRYPSQDANGPTDPYPGPPAPTAEAAALYCGPPDPAPGMRYEYEQECVESSGVAAEAAEKHKAAWEAAAAAINDAGTAINNQLLAEEAHYADLNSINTSFMTPEEKATHLRKLDIQHGIVAGLVKALQQLHRAWYETTQRLASEYYEDMRDCCISVQEGGGGGSTTGGQNGDATTPPPPHIRPIGPGAPPVRPSGG